MTIINKYKIAHNRQQANTGNVDEASISESFCISIHWCRLTRTATGEGGQHAIGLARHRTLNWLKTCSVWNLWTRRCHQWSESSNLSGICRQRRRLWNVGCCGGEIWVRWQPGDRGAQRPGGGHFRESTPRQRHRSAEGWLWLSSVQRKNGRRQADVSSSRTGLRGSGGDPWGVHGWREDWSQTSGSNIAITRRLLVR